MGVRRFTVKLTSIAKEIKKARKKLESIKHRVDAKARKKIGLDIKKLDQITRQLPCKKMTSTY